MMRELKNKLFLVLTFVSVLVLITGCGSTANVSKKYFTGYNSVDMNFLADSPPSIFYYDSEAVIGSEINTLPINVQIANQGSADSYGALFVSGFDPLLVSFDGYTNNYPGSTLGQYRPLTLFDGYFSNNGGIGALQIPLSNGGTASLTLANIAGQSSISFNSFGFSSRTALLQNIGFASQASRYASAGYTGISTGVLNARIGAPLNAITTGLFNTYGWTNWLQKFDLEGRNNDNPAGGMEVIQFPATILQLPASLEEFPQPITVTSCFDYTTHATAMVCIDPQPYSNVVKTCKATNIVSLAGGQGAPVAITSIEQKPAKGRTTFVINVHHNRQNAGDILYDYFSLYKCDPAADQIVKSTDLNVVYIGYVYLSNEIDITMNCLPNQMIRLDASGNGQITCSLDYPAGMAPTGAYTAPLEVELWYGYSKSISRNVIIRKI
jgi:hypothetical protein